MSQVPSDLRVTVVPSGRVTLAVENDRLPAVPVITDEPVLDDTAPLPDCIVVVLPSMVVDDEMPPPPVVTVLVLLPADPVPSMMVQVVASSNSTVSEA